MSYAIEAFRSWIRRLPMSRRLREKLTSGALVLVLPTMLGCVHAWRLAQRRAGSVRMYYTWVAGQPLFGSACFIAEPLLVNFSALILNFAVSLPECSS